MRWAQPRPPGRMPAANGGILRHPGWGGSQAYEGHDQRTKACIYSFLPFTTALCCLPALDCFCIFSASAVYWVTLMQTCPQRVSHPTRPFLCHQLRQPLSSGAIDMGWEMPEPALL